MIDVVTDLHLHSKYSRAVSPQMTPQVMAQFGKAKGLDILATGDWTHPMWYRELKSQLVESEEGLYKLKSSNVIPAPASTQRGEQAGIHPSTSLREEMDPRSESGMTSNRAGMTENQRDVRFLLSVEIACIYSQGGKGRRIHNLVFVPSFEVAEKVNKELLKRGCNLSSDGRPIIGLSSKNLLQMLLEIDERSLLIPAHAWTPWFGIYGQMSGFNSLREAFEDLAPFVYGIETGLSSDPEMNWQIPELDTRSILSFSDAHSAPKMGREATVFRLEELSYENMRKAIMNPSLRSVIPAKAGIQENGSPIGSGMTNGKIAASQAPRNDDMNKVIYTVEFYPEEGKYHYSGHRNCNVTMTPQEQKKAQNICPVCKRPVTDGVMRRVQELAPLRQGFGGASKKKSPTGLQWIADPTGVHPPFVRLVPLLEIIAEALAVPVGSPKAKVVFDTLCQELDSELHILLRAPIEAIEKSVTSVTTPVNAKRVAEGVKKVREADIVIKPGYDGVYGVVKIWKDQKTEDGKQITDSKIQNTEKQIGLEF